MVRRWPWHSVDQHLLGHALVRCSAQDRESLVRASQRAREAFTRRALEGPGVLPAAARAPLLRAGFWCVDHGRSLLLTVILGYQLIDWWYNSAEAALAPQKRPVPPPPPVAPPAPDGVPLPEDPKLCPLCREPFRNESVLAVSGYVFCYSCILTHVSQTARCPVSRLPAHPEHVRRLFITQA